MTLPPSVRLGPGRLLKAAEVGRLELSIAERIHRISRSSTDEEVEALRTEQAAFQNFLTRHLVFLYRLSVARGSSVDVDSFEIRALEGRAALLDGGAGPWAGGLEELQDGMERVLADLQDRFPTSGLWSAQAAWLEYRSRVLIRRAGLGPAAVAKQLAARVTEERRLDLERLVHGIGSPCRGRTRGPRTLVERVERGAR